VIFLAGLTILNKERCLGFVGGSEADPVVALCLPPTYFKTTWHQTRAFLISVNSKSDFSGLFDNFE
jgi:hypothetical protein